jgi:CRP/FNR family cyclic AMP-dependent transcriptional regulator
LTSGRHGPNDPASLLGGRFDMFQWMSEDGRKLYAAAAQVRTVPSGQIITRQGDIASEFLRVLEGAVRLSSLRPDGREVIYMVLGPGDCFGSGSVIDREPIAHTAQARGDVLLQSLSLAAFNQLRATVHEFDDALLRFICRQMRVLSSYVENAALDDLLRRVARRLVEVARPAAGGGSAVHLSQAELALMCGGSRQATNRALKQFEDEGLIQLSYGSIILRDLFRLRLHAEPDG